MNNIEKLRDKFFKECTDNVQGVNKVNLAPHDLFEWFKRNINITNKQRIRQALGRLTIVYTEKHLGKFNREQLKCKEDIETLSKALEVLVK